MSRGFAGGISPRLFWGFWTGFALLSGAQTWLLAAHTGHPGPAGPAGPALHGFLRAYVWAVLALVALAVAYRFPLEAGRWRRNLALTLGLTVSAVVALDLAWWLFASRVLGTGGRPLGLYMVASLSGGSSIFLNFVGVGHAVAFVRRYRERELAASRLQARLAEAHLQVLKTQLQPHFLFNTFHSISALMYRDPRAANRMLTRLSDLLRLTLHRSATQEVTLQEELDGLALYLEIEQTRFSDRLRVEWAVDDAVRDACVPHLVLQPLVENAIRHGISKRKGPGVVTVSAKADGDALRLEVRDNGPGLPPAGAWRNGGIGLANTRGRLEQLYGEGQTFGVRDAQGGGAVAALCIPLRFSKGTTMEEQEAAG